MATVCKLPKLPRDPKDGAEVCDKYGNRWRFSGEQDGWVSRGLIQTLPPVTESTDGVVTPDILDRLSKVRTLVNSGFNVPPLKILPGLDAYWYYFRSSDKFIKFKPEGEDALRLEVDRGRLFQVLAKQVCPGPRGDKGDIGDRGRSGKPGPAEVCYGPSGIVNDKLDFAIITPTPLLGDRSDIELPNEHVPDLSIRIFKVTLPRRSSGVVTNSLATHDPLQYLAAYYHGMPVEAAKFQAARDLLVQQSLGILNLNVCEHNLSPVLAAPVGSVIDKIPVVTILVDPLGVVKPRVSYDRRFPVDINKTVNSVKFDPETGIVCGSIYLQNNRPWEGEFCVKSRQRGPDGKPGRDGESAIKIVECVLDTTSIFATCPIVTARIDCERQAVFTVCADIVSQVCVDGVRLAANSGSLSNRSAINASFAAAQMVLGDCKLIERYQVELAEDEFDELDLAHWTPQPGCVTRRHYDRHKFNWVKETDVPACDEAVRWYGPNGVVRAGKYPWYLGRAKPPEKDECCVAAGSLIHTASGLVPIENLKVGDRVLCPDQTFKPIEQFYDNGLKECIRINFTDGSSVVCTPDHKFPVGGRLVEAADLVTSDLLHKTPGANLVVERPGDDDDYEDGYLLGYLFGDGWISDKSVGLLAHRNDMVELEYVASIMAKKFGARKLRGPDDGGVYSYVWSNRVVVDHFISLGYYKSLPERRVKLPSSLLSKSWKFYQGFFSALVNTDGSVLSDGRVNINWSITPTLPTICKKLLDYLGYPSTLKQQRQTVNKFTTNIGPCWRVDLLACDPTDLLIGLSERKAALLVNRTSDTIDPMHALPVTTDDTEYRSGLVAGAYTFWGSYDHCSGRASVQRGMPTTLRLSLDLPLTGSKFFKNARSTVGVAMAGDTANISWAIGFLTAAMCGRGRLAKNRSLTLTRVCPNEADMLAAVLTTTGCQFKRLLVGRQHRLIVNKSYDIYRLMNLAGRRADVQTLGLWPALAGRGVVGVRSIESIGPRLVYDYKVSPHYLMAVDGIMAYDCQEPFFYCPNVQAGGCLNTGAGGNASSSQSVTT